MLKTVTLRCENCGEKITFKVGADSSLNTWREAIATVADRKEAERINEMYQKIAATKSGQSACDFSFNAAEPLNNVAYGICGEETIKLVESLPDEYAAAIFSEKVMTSTDGSATKWNEAVARDCFFAYHAIYICPKSRHPQQGVHLSLHYKDGKAQRVVSLANRCGECSSKTILADDGNLGFMHEGCPTTARCPKCNGKLTVDSVSFKVNNN